MSFDLYKKKLLIALAEYDRWQKSLSNTGVFCTIRYWKYFSDDSKKRLKDWIPFVRSLRKSDWSCFIDLKLLDLKYCMGFDNIQLYSKKGSPVYYCK